MEEKKLQVVQALDIKKDLVLLERIEVTHPQNLHHNNRQGSDLESLLPVNNLSFPLPNKQGFS